MFARGLEQPYISQLSLGYQRQVGGAWSVAVDGVWVESRNLPRSWDLNAPDYTLQPGDTVHRSPEWGDPRRPVDPAVGGGGAGRDGSVKVVFNRHRMHVFDR